MMMVNGLAPILAPVIGGQILSFSSWHSIFQFLALIGLIMAAATLIYKETLQENDRISSIGGSLKAFPKLLQDRYFLGHCLVQSFIFVSFFCYIGSSSFIFQGIYQVSAQSYSYIFGLIGIGLMVVGVLPAKLAGKVPEAKIMKYALISPVVTCCLLLAAFMFYSPLWLVILLILFSVVPISVLGATSFSLALNKQGKNAGSASAALGFASMFLGGLCMPLAGYFGTDTGIPMAVIMVIGYGLGYLCFTRMIAPAHEELQ